jgi:hypothetical protein
MNSVVTIHGKRFDLRAHELEQTDADTAFNAIDERLDALGESAVSDLHASGNFEVLESIASGAVSEITATWREDWYKSGASPFVEINPV